MKFGERVSPLRLAVVGFLVAIAVGTLIELLVFEGDLVRASITAGGIGLGVGIAVYVVRSARA